MIFQWRKFLDIFEAYQYCPICGHHKTLQPQSKGSVKCSVCGYELYKNPTIGGVAVITDDENRLLVVKRSKDPAKGTWHLPGGFVEVGETVEQGIAREIKEELNIDIEVEQYLFSIPNRYLYHNIECFPLDFFFKCRIKDMSSLHIDLTENSEYTLLRPQDIKVEDFGLPSIREGIRRYLKK